MRHAQRSVRLRSLAVVAAVVSAALAGINCSPFSPDLGGTPYLCATSEPRCPDSYACMDDGAGRMVCVGSGGMTPDSSEPTGFECSTADGPPIEPNDTKESAYVTDVSPTITRRYGPLAICPETDRDHFQINVTVANKGIETIVSWNSGAPLTLSILNAAGASINNAIAMGDKAMRGCVTNLPVGTYYAAVLGTTQNNYYVDMKLIDACQ